MSYHNVILSFLLYGFCGVTCAQEFIREFHFVNKSLNWTEAQQFCREHYTDLATVSNLEEVNELQRPDSYSGDAWIGLKFKGVGYQNWGMGFVNNWCTGLYCYGEWRDHICSHQHNFVCYRIDDLHGKTFYFNTALRTYAEAQEYCRKYYTDLALIESAEENNHVTSLFNHSYHCTAWIHKPWHLAWSDGSSSTFTNWASDCPLEVKQYNCTVEEPNHSWRNVNCNQSLPFFCHRDVTRNGSKRHTMVKVSFHSDLNMIDPRNNKVLLQKIQEAINQPGVKVTWRSPPERNAKKKRDEM